MPRLLDFSPVCVFLLVTEFPAAGAGRPLCAWAACAAIPNEANRHSVRLPRRCLPCDETSIPQVALKCHYGLGTLQFRVRSFVPKSPPRSPSWRPSHDAIEILRFPPPTPPLPFAVIAWLRFFRNYPRFFPFCGALAVCDSSDPIRRDYLIRTAESILIGASHLTSRRVRFSVRDNIDRLVCYRKPLLFVLSDASPRILGV